MINVAQQKSLVMLNCGKLFQHTLRNVYGCSILKVWPQCGKLSTLTLCMPCIRHLAKLVPYHICSLAKVCETGKLSKKPSENSF